MRAIRMSAQELNSYTKDLIAQGESLERNLIDLSLYSNGSFTYSDLLQLPLGQVRMIQDSIVQKNKKDKGSKETQYL